MGGGCYSGLSKKRSFLRQFPHKIFRKFAHFPKTRRSFPRSSSHVTSPTNQTNASAPHPTPIHRANLRPSRKLLLLFPITSTLGILALVSTFFISSDIASNSYALDGTNLNSEVTAEIDGTHYVALSASDVTFSITPTNGTASDKKQVDVDLSTNVSGGASLYLSTSSDKNALYLNGDTNSTSQNIASASSTTTYDNMINNTWAYSTDDINYQGVPTLDSPVLLSDIDGTSTGTNTNGVVSASIPIYYAAKVDTSIPPGSYANSVTYSAVVDGGIVTSATLTSIAIGGENTDPMEMQTSQPNTILVTTNLKTNAYGTPRVYYQTTSPSGYSECDEVVVSSNDEGYMTVQCTVTPEVAATGVTLHIAPKGNPDDPFCKNNTYPANSSQCEAGDWKWGSLTVNLPDISLAHLMSEISAMQDMTPEFCASVTKYGAGKTARLEDLRDSKMYWVAKLKDGNCWMTQNLELDLTSGEPLTPELSDVSVNWNPGATTFTSAQEGVRGSSYYNTVQSWNLGKYVWKTPNSTSYCQPDTNLSESSCASYWQDVSTWAPMTEYRTDGVTYDANSQTYDAHYLAGNYYSWQAATAGTAPSGSGTASGSICPKGFELPPNTGDNSYNSLISAYNISSNTAGGTAMRSVPLFFVRSGYVNPTNYLYYAGNYGYYWSSVASSSSYAYCLSFYSSSVNLSNYGYRYYGRSVRCVAPSA